MVNAIPRGPGFHRGDLYKDGWGFCSTDGSFLQAASLDGKTVNIGTKDGLVYEGTTVTGFDPGRGVLTVKGGQCGRPRFQPGSDPVDEPELISVYDVARGYVHEEEGDQDEPG